MATSVRTNGRTQAAPASGPVVNLALQGGGSHGAYTWGVLDALLEDGRVTFEGITGASAGAMNATVLADGMLDRPRDPREGARQGLYDFWRAISRQTGFASFGALPVAITNAMMQIPALAQLAQGTYALDHNPVYIAYDLLSRLASPYQLNPLDFNPLRDVLNQWVDFERLRTQSPLKLFVCATSVRTGRPKVFREHELTCDMLLGSACLPFLFQAPEIDGEYYWDGGFSGNPPLFPLHTETRTRDIVLVAINPLDRPQLPTRATEIVERVNEISFNSSLMLEMRMIEFVTRLIDQAKLDTKRYKRVLMHMISSEAQLRDYGASSKYNTSWDFLVTLRDLGREAGRAWLAAHFDALGKRSTVDIAKVFL